MAAVPVIKNALLLTLLLALFASSVCEGRQLKEAKSKSAENIKKDQVTDRFEESKMMDKNDFRPTNPGNSPGVGHSLQASMKQTPKPQVHGHHNTNSDVHSLTGSAVNDFRPTGPGHSPGVGHTVEDNAVEPKV